MKVQALKRMYLVIALSLLSCHCKAQEKASVVPVWNAQVLAEKIALARRPSDALMIAQAQAICQQDFKKISLTHEQKKFLLELTGNDTFVALLEALCQSSNFMEGIGDFKKEMLYEAAMPHSLSPVGYSFNELDPKYKLIPPSLANFRLLVSKGVTTDWVSIICDIATDPNCRHYCCREIYTHAIAQSLHSADSLETINKWIAKHFYINFPLDRTKREKANSLMYFGFSFPVCRVYSYSNSFLQSHHQIWNRYIDGIQFIEHFHARRVHRMAHYLRYLCKKYYNGMDFPLDIAFHIAQLHYGPLTDDDKLRLKTYGPYEFLVASKSHGRSRKAYEEEERVAKKQCVQANEK